MLLTGCRADRLEIPMRDAFTGPLPTHERRGLGVAGGRGHEGHGGAGIVCVTDRGKWTDIEAASFNRRRLCRNCRRRGMGSCENVSRSASVARRASSLSADRSGGRRLSAS